MIKFFCKRNSKDMFNGKPLYHGFPRPLDGKHDSAKKWMMTYNRREEVKEFTIENEFTAHILDNVSLRGMSSKIPQVALYLKDEDVYIRLDGLIDILCNHTVSKGIIMKTINDCDYLVIDVNTKTVDDELIEEIDFTFNFSAYTINKAKLLYGISIPAFKRITVREWNTYACDFENVLLEIPEYCLVSGYRSFNDMSQWLLTYSESKPLLKLVDDVKFSIDLLTVMKIASTNIESINMVKKFHHNRLMKMIDEND